MGEVIGFPQDSSLREHLAEFVADAERNQVRSLALVWVDRKGDTGTAYLVESRDLLRVCRALEAVALDTLPEDDEEA